MQERIFKNFSQNYAQALEYAGQEKFFLAKTKYLEMLDSFERLKRLNTPNHILQISHLNLLKIFQLLNKEKAFK